MKCINFTILFFLFCYMTRLSFTSPISDYNFTIICNDSDIDLSNDVQFFLYTRQNENNPQQLWIDDKEGLDKSLYDLDKVTKFVAHGWTDSYQGNNSQIVKNAFLIHADYNVITVNWENIAMLAGPEAASFTKQVAGYIAKMIDFLASEGSNLSDMSLVGHSLGAHVIGLAGYYASNEIAHVVGLDPAAGFTSGGFGEGISTSDATMVEIIHSNAGRLGIVEPIGHADFYPNGGGIAQPDCEKDADPDECAHSRAYIYYAEALTTSNSLLAVRCKDYDEFLAGECNNEPVSFPNWSGIDKKERGSYFLRTANKEPFGMGIDGTAPSGTANILVFRGSLFNLSAIFIVATFVL